jgi:hypothetical protein
MSEDATPRLPARRPECAGKLTLSLEFELNNEAASVIAAEIQDGGAVANAGGLVGDRWLEIDGEPALQVIEHWARGVRVRQPMVPMTIKVLRGAQELTIRAAWTVDEEKAPIDSRFEDAPTDSDALIKVDHAPVTLAELVCASFSAGARRDNDKPFSDPPDAGATSANDAAPSAGVPTTVAEERPGLNTWQASLRIRLGKPLHATVPDEVHRWFEWRSRRSVSSAVSADYDPFADF